MTDIRPFDPALFGDAAIDPDTANLNAQMIELLTGQPEWWIVGAQEARAARRRGEGPFPAPVFSDRARTITITGKEGNQIPLRIIAPAQPRIARSRTRSAVANISPQDRKDGSICDDHPVGAGEDWTNARALSTRSSGQ